MKKMITLLLAMVMMLSIIPMTALAAPQYAGPTKAELDEIKQESALFPLDPDLEYAGPTKAEEDLLKDQIAKYPLQPGVESGPVHNSRSEHENLFWNCNTVYHWMECACGARLNMEHHVDPLETEDDYCKCGYHFSSNADLVTLWVKGCPGIKYFDKNKTEYELDAYTYKDVKEIKIRTRTHDCCATVELPEDLTLKEGKNTFEVKVTAENKKVTKTYTLVINKEAQ